MLLGCQHRDAPARDAGAAPAQPIAAPAKPIPPEVAGALATAVTEMQGFRDRTCACADAACANAVVTEMRAWAKTQAPLYKDIDSATVQQQLSGLTGEVAGCLKRLTSPSPAVDPAHVDAVVTEAITAMTGFRDQACACHDPSCAQAVGKAMIDWAGKRAMAMKDAVPGDQQRAAMQQVSDAIQTCLRAANSGK
jgi:hypothetical protein